MELSQCEVARSLGIFTLSFALSAVFYMRFETVGLGSNAMLNIFLCLYFW